MKFISLALALSTAVARASAGRDTRLKDAAAHGASAAMGASSSGTPPDKIHSELNSKVGSNPATDNKDETAASRKLSAIVEAGVLIQTQDKNNETEEESLIVSEFAIAVPPACATVINFDDEPEPCLFGQTTPLRNKYSAFGVTFVGPNSNDGGAILDECSNFAVEGQSSPNFLAFNEEAEMSDGSIPSSPETIIFNETVHHVQINAGSQLSVGKTVTIQCYDESDMEVGSDSVNITRALATLQVSVPSVAKCTITGQGTYFVLDDLAFCVSPTLEPTPAPTPKPTPAPTPKPTRGKASAPKMGKASASVPKAPKTAKASSSKPEGTKGPKASAKARA